jgi:hypothetical protein
VTPRQVASGAGGPEPEHVGEESTMAEKKDNRLEIGGRAQVSGGAFSVGDGSSASHVVQQGPPDDTVPRDLPELRAKVAELLARLRSGDASVQPGVPTAEQLSEEVEKESPDGYRVKGLLGTLTEHLGGASALAGSLTALVKAVKALFGV